MSELPSREELLQLSRRAAIYLIAQSLSQVEDCLRLPDELPDRDYYARCFSIVATSGRRFAAGEAIDPHETPGMAAAALLSGVKSSSFADEALRRSAADAAGAARLLALAIARAKRGGARPALDVARYAAEALELIASAAGATRAERGAAITATIRQAFDALVKTDPGSAGELGRTIDAAEFERLWRGAK